MPLRLQSHVYEGHLRTLRRHTKTSVQVLVAWAGSPGGSSQSFAEATKRLFGVLAAAFSPFKIDVTILTFDECISVLETQSSESNEASDDSLSYLIACLSTDVGGEAPENGLFSLNLLKELYEDQRVGTGQTYTHLQGMGIIGFGDAAYGKELFCLPSKQASRYLTRLLGPGRSKCLLPPNMVDRSASESFFGKHYTSQNHYVQTLFLTLMRHVCTSLSRNVIPSSKLEAPLTAMDDSDVSEDDNESADDEDWTGNSGTERPMIEDRQADVLKKQGYHLVGSHSATKLCRWTKSHLKGRGGCYKHTFYGIDSSGCMEATPSLACANKCSFCWRHHKNPVGTSWRWSHDEPEMIVEGLLKEHMSMVRSLEHAPGIKVDRYERQAQMPRHCALSLVGEPIMYPRIQDLLDLLHAQGLSTFLVTNGQFPEAMDAINCVTQLYISIDAADEETFNKIDRPLFADGWDRLLQCVDRIRDRPTLRTTYRLTMVKDGNLLRLPTDPSPTDPRQGRGPIAPPIPSLEELPLPHHEEARKYCQLIDRGRPSLVEVKGFTYCGDGKGKDSLTISNVPYFEELTAFCERVLAINDGHLMKHYDIAAVHKHSLSVLLARRDFYDAETDTWKIWIDYDEFSTLASRQKSTGRPFHALDYSIAAPEWTQPSSEALGFDPDDTRHIRNRIKRVGDVVEVDNNKD